MKRSPDTLAALGLALSIAASCVLSVLPLYASSSGHSATLFQVNGPGVVLVLLLPVILSALGLSTSRGLRVFAGLTLLALAFTTALGLYYIPSGLLLVAAAYQTLTAAREDARALTIIGRGR